MISIPIFQKKHAHSSIILFQNWFVFLEVVKSRLRFKLLILKCSVHFETVNLPSGSCATGTNQKLPGLSQLPNFQPLINAFTLCLQ